MLDIRPVAFIVGWLVFVLGALMLLPFALDLADGDPNARAFGMSAVVTMLGGAAVALASEGGWTTALSLRQGFLLTTGAWAIFPTLTGLPMMLGSPGLGFTDAYFEAMSAMTTTGATVIAGLDDLPRGLLLWRGLLQWVGGIGVILLAMILLPVLNVGGMQLLRNADFNTLGKIMPRTKHIAISIGSLYAGLTLACALGYVWAGMSTFDGFVHAMTTLATGGMGNYDASFAGFSPAAQYVATTFMLIGAMSFGRYVQLARGEGGRFLGDTQMRAFLVVYLSFAAALLAARLLNADAVNEPVVREVLFNLASVISTTGYASTDYSLWGSLAWALFFCVMMICGCSGSTAGGPKVFRYQLLLSAITAQIRRLHSPNVVFNQRYQGRPVSLDVMDSVMAFFMMFFLTLGIGSVALVLLGLDPVTAITGAATCLSNVGPGLGPEIGPAGNFAGLPDPAKWVMSFLMLAGRLEIMTVYVLFTAAFWRG